MSNQATKASRLALEKSLIDGTQKHLANQTFVIGKQTVTAQDVINVIQGRVNTAQAVNTAKAALQAARKTDTDQRALTKPFEDSFIAIVQGMFKDTPDILADFGLKPRKAPKVTVRVKAEAIAKNKATRVARHTTGKKAKKLITGTVNAAPAAPTPTPAQAPVVPAAPPLVTTAPPKG